MTVMVKLTLMSMAALTTVELTRVPGIDEYVAVGDRGTFKVVRVTHFSPWRDGSTRHYKDRIVAECHVERL